MARPRKQLSKILHEILKALNISEKNCYFSPPNGIQLNYPCILYELSNANAQYADNQKYLVDMRYVVTVIDRSPDSKLRDAILELPKCSFDRSFTSENLNHYVFTLYF